MNEFLMLLLDASWRIAALAVIVALGLKLGRVKDPALAHLAWRGVLLGMLALPVLSLWAPALPVSPPAALAAAPAAFEALVPVVESVPLEVPAAASSAVAALSSAPASTAAMAPIAAEPVARVVSRAVEWPWALFLVLVYGLGVVAMAARLVGAWWLTRHLVAVGEPLTGACVERHTRLIAGAPRRRVSFRIHHQVRVPLATGWWRPAVLLPVDWHGWDEATQRYALAHELTHIRRGDYVVQLLSAVNRCLFWFHPLAWMLPERLASLAERACDQEVVERCGDRPRYARVLLRVAASVAAGPPRPAWIGASMLDGDGLSPRIEAVLATPRRRRLPRRWATGVLAGLLIAGVAGAAVLEVEPTPEPPEALAVPAVPTAPRVPAPSVAPVAPVAPLAPRNEAAPTVPVVPSAPVAPSAPTESSAPAAPTAPSAPTAPVLAPSLAPEAPSAPTAPRPGLPAVAPAPPPAPEVRDRPVVVAALPALPASGFDLSAELAGPADDGEPETAASPAVEPCAVARNYILWFDDQGRRPFQGEPLSATPKRWLEDVGRWIRDDLCPADRVAIVSFKGKMRIDQDFTRDREAAVQALDQVTRWKPSRVAAPPAAGEPSLLRALPSKRELRWRSGEIDRALDLLGEIAATVEGRKDLIVLTRGFVEWNEIGARNGTGGYGLRTIYRSQAERIRAAGVVVHAIQTGPGSFYLWGGVSALTHRTGGFIYGTHNYWESRAQSHAVRSRQARDYSVLDGLRAIIRAIELEAS